MREIESCISSETLLFREPAARLTQLCHSKAHQGYLAKMGKFPYTDLDSMVQEAAEKTGKVWIVLDRIQDPYNTGAIIRSAEVFGIEGIVISDVQQCGVNSMVARTSAGAVNRIPVARVPGLAQALKKLRDSGIRITGTDMKQGTPLHQYDFSTPSAVILGNEAEGMRPEIRELCGSFIRIPQAGSIGSLNVAAAAAVICYEAQRYLH